MYGVINNPFPLTGTSLPRRIWYQLHHKHHYCITSMYHGQWARSALHTNNHCIQLYDNVHELFSWWSVACSSDDSRCQVRHIHTVCYPFIIYSIDEILTLHVTIVTQIRKIQSCGKHGFPNNTLFVFDRNQRQRLYKDQWNRILGSTRLRSVIENKFCTKKRVIRH